MAQADLVERCEALLALGDTQRSTAPADHRETVLAAAHLARQAGEPALLARAATGIARSFLTSTGAPDPERIAVVEAAVAAHRADSPTRARLLASLAGERVLAGERTTATTLIDEAVAVARRIDDGPSLAMALATRWDVLFHPATLEERLRLAAELEEGAEVAGDDAFRWRAATVGTTAGLEVGDRAAVERHLTRADALADALGDPLARFVTALQWATWALVQGHPEAAERRAARARQLGREAGSDLADLAFAAQVAQVRAAQGRLGTMAREVGLSQRDVPATRAAYALMCAEAGRRAEAANAFASVVAHTREPVPRDVTWAFGMAALAETCFHLGDAARAAQLEAALAPCRHQHLAHASYYLGPASHPLGLLRAAQGDRDGADELLVEAEVALRAFGAPAHLARTRLARCRVLAASPHRGDGRRVAEVARPAAADARAAGLDGLADQLEAQA